MAKNDAVLDQTNPVYNTAKMTLSILGKAGVPEAVTAAEKLGFSGIRSEFAVGNGNMSDESQSVIQESRYSFLNRAVRESGCRNVVDIACGFSPRGYLLAREGFNYTGIDLEASVGTLNKFSAKVSREGLKGSFRYIACDATDDDALVNALDSIDGELIIICEGLWTYLQYFEAECMCRGIRRVLLKHGGTYVTADFDFPAIYRGVYHTVMGAEKGEASLMEFACATATKSDCDWSKTLTPPDSENSYTAEEFFGKCGLAVKRIPYYDGKEKLHVFDQLDAGTVEKVKNTLGGFTGWQVVPSDTDESCSTHQIKNISSASCRTEDGVLRFELKGRMDSITSGGFLEEYRKAEKAGGFDSAELDMSGLDYISSAGLRVILIICKAVPGGVRVKNASPAVCEILDTTGFSDILDIV